MPMLTKDDVSEPVGDVVGVITAVGHRPGRGGDIIFQPGRPGDVTGGQHVSIPPRGGDIVFRRFDGTEALRLRHDGAFVAAGSEEVTGSRELLLLFRGWLSDAVAVVVPNEDGDGSDVLITGGGA